MSKLSPAKVKILDHYKQHDQVAFNVMVQHPELLDLGVAEPSARYFGNLCKTIIFQQLSGKVGQILFDRLVTLCNQPWPEANSIHQLTVEELRSIGLSNSKARYVKDLALQTSTGTVQLSKLEQMDDERVITELTKVTGIGKWTAEMFLMFTLNREDVFSLGDLGLQKGAQKLYGLKEHPKKDWLLEITERWRPFRTYGAMMLWKYLDNGWQ